MNEIRSFILPEPNVETYRSEAFKQNFRSRFEFFFFFANYGLSVTCYTIKDMHNLPEIVKSYQDGALSDFLISKNEIIHF